MSKFDIIRRLLILLPDIQVHSYKMINMKNLYKMYMNIQLITNSF